MLILRRRNLMDRERIELTARGKLEIVLSRLGYVTPEIPANDKSPSWDGCIRLYNNKESTSKTELAKLIPIQLKGHYQTPPYNDSISYNAEVSDLKNYLQNNGVIFFVVCIDENDNYRIYYDTLTKLKLRRTIKGKENQKYISINLQSFPEKNKEEAVDIFFQFSLDLDMSRAIPNKDITLQDVFKNPIPGFDSFNISYRGIKYKNDPFEYFLSHPTTVSLKNSYTGISFPVDTLFLQAISTKHKEPITVAGVKYFENYETIRQKNNTLVIKIGKSFSFNMQVTSETISGKFNYTIQGNLKERINDTRFLLAYLSNKEFEIGKVKGFRLTGEQINSVDTVYLQNNLRLLEKISELFMSLSVSEILDYDQLTENDERRLIDLINTVLLGATCIPDEPKKLYKLKFANITILLIANKIDEANYEIINFFSPKNKIQCSFSYEDDSSKKRMLVIPKTFILREDDFSVLNNIDFNMLYNDICQSQSTSELKEYTYYFIKEMIKGYQKRTKDKKQLCKCIKKTLLFLTENVNEFDYSALLSKFEE